VDHLNNSWVDQHLLPGLYRLPFGRVLADDGLCPNYRETSTARVDIIVKSMKDVDVLEDELTMWLVPETWLTAEVGDEPAPTSTFHLENLISNDGIRFIVVDGVHRLAALKTLDHECDIPFRFFYPWENGAKLDIHRIWKAKTIKNWAGSKRNVDDDLSLLLRFITNWNIYGKSILGNRVKAFCNETCVQENKAWKLHTIANVLVQEKELFRA